MEGSELWLAVLLVVYVVIFAAVVLYAKVSTVGRDIEYRNGDLRREVGAVKREIEYRANAHARDLERLLSERRTSR